CERQAGGIHVGGELLEPRLMRALAPRRLEIGNEGRGTGQRPGQPLLPERDEGRPVDEGPQCQAAGAERDAQPQRWWTAASLRLEGLREGDVAANQDLLDLALDEGEAVVGAQ